MRRTLLLLIPLFLLLSVGQAFAGSSRPSVDAPPSAKVGQVAPEVTLKTLDGQKVPLSQYRGKVVVFNFWATWCPPCRAEMPSMERLYQQLQGLDVVILAVNAEADGETAVKEFLKDNPYNFTFLLDADAEAQDSYSVFRFPETFIINKDGVILNHIVGGREWDDKTTVDYLKFLAKG